MAYNPNVPAPANLVQDDIAAMRENFQHLDPLAQAVGELQTVSGLAPYVQAILDSRIVEMGSNSNGTYVRWENGLQVCWTNVLETVNITSSSTLGGYYGDGSARSFPAAFAAIPVVLVTQDNGPFALAHNVSSSGYRVRYRSIASVSDWSNSVYVFAIGRWK